MTLRDTGGQSTLFRTPLERYGVAIGAALMAALVRVPFEPVLDGKAPFALFYLPVVFVAWYCGTIPTALTTLISLLIAQYFFISPRYEWRIEDKADVAALVLFVAVSAALTALSRAASRIRHRAEDARAMLERTQAPLARLAAIVESSEDAIISKSTDGIIQAWNAAAERLFGYSAEEAIGRSIMTLVPPDRIQEEENILQRLRGGEKLQNIETVRRAKDGRLIDLSLTMSPVRDSSGHVIGVSKIARDITERKRIEHALAEQREWFRVTLSSIGDAVIASDRNGGVTFMNRVAEELTGWKSTEVEGRPLAEVFDIFNEETREPVENPFEKVIRTRHIFGLANHTVLRSRDGTERPIADSAAPILDDAENILGVVLVFHDVTERRRAEHALAEQREWFETTLESIGDAVLTTDIRRRVTFVNPVAEHLTGFRLEDAKGRDLLDVFRIVNEQTRQAVEDPVSRVLKEGIVVGLANHTVLIAADGTERPIDDSAAPIRDRTGRIVGVVLVFRDVSERRRADTAKQQLMEQRERLLTSERLARADAEKASRLKDEFVATISHELRTPLTAIVGWIHMLQLRAEDPEYVKRGLAIIERNVGIQTQLVSDLLDVSRIIAGKLRLEVQPVDLRLVVQGAIETHARAADAKRIQIHHSLDPNIGRIVGDPARLQQVVWNLLGNAIKFTPDGGHIEVALRETESSAEIVVADSGIGIHLDFLSRLFERFTQAEGSPSRRFGGLGLGLSVVRELVSLHGGTVTAESAGEGQGATFTVSLPLILADIESVPVRDDDAFPSSVDAAKLRGLHILVVEDESDTRSFLQQILEECGAAVRTASDAQAALQQFEEDQPNLIVCDIGLPGMDGYELVRRIRGRSANEGGTIPAIAVTAFAGPEDRTRALSAGYQAHLAKPIHPGDLVMLIASFAGLLPSRAGARMN